MEELENLMVSVDMITYGHENYISQAIEGILMQETDFEFDLIIADDCSPDNTQEIVERIIKNHPKGYKIKYFRHKQNLGMLANGLFALQQCMGKYVAICEGDDYWTDPLKLQKQVNFLETHKEYSLCCGGYRSKNIVTGEIIENIFSNNISTDKRGFKFTLADIKERWLIKTFTCVFKKSVISNLDFEKYDFFRDVHLFYHLLENSKGYYFCEDFGVYNIHEGGIWSMVETVDKNKTSYLVYKELYKYNKTAHLRSILFDVIYTKLYYANRNKYEENTAKKRFKLFFELFFLIRNISEIKNFIRVLIPVKIENRIKKFVIR